jgi:hypothetical protein
MRMMRAAVPKVVVETKDGLPGLINDRVEGHRKGGAGSSWAPKQMLTINERVGLFPGTVPGRACPAFRVQFAPMV